MPSLACLLSINFIVNIQLEKVLSLPLMFRLEINYNVLVVL